MRIREGMINAELTPRIGIGANVVNAWLDEGAISREQSIQQLQAFLNS
jgi:hypothetical protein